jgi:pimeloyl-ACP methyl ester carboxylesterase
MDGRRQAVGTRDRAKSSSNATVRERVLAIAPGGLEAIVAVPAAAKGVVLFAHGSGSSRLSPRNALVAHALQRAGIATILFDLLTDREAADRRNVFDIALLAERLLLATRWAAEMSDLRGLPTGYFGASTGAAAALVAAAELGPNVAAIVSRGGRPDLAGEALPRVVSPTLLIVGGADLPTLAVNREAFAVLACEKALEIVQRATHLFEERGALEEVVKRARHWFDRHLGRES